MIHGRGCCRHLSFRISVDLGFWMGYGLGVFCCELSEIGEVGKRGEGELEWEVSNHVPVFVFDYLLYVNWIISIMCNG
jgi:hypothetical protein